MLRLSTKGRYGLRAAFDLALHYGEGPQPLRDIAERQEISEPYLEQLMAALRKAGLLKSIRGAQGGYVLAADPAEITVGSVIRALEGATCMVECTDEDGRCAKADHCPARLVWQRIQASIDGVMDSMTLQDMLEDYKNLNADAYMYYI
ncbi:RrF2 family transcriptional regulator [Gehongia tenuis]|uniref:RrF2 family transcriptional regulator n=1 Tax=Gehongia tenuis TaxID=2763655 RepID=UPI0038B3BF40